MAKTLKAMTDDEHGAGTTDDTMVASDIVVSAVAPRSVAVR